MEELNAPPLIIAKLFNFRDRGEIEQLVESPSECNIFSFPDFLSKTVTVGISYSGLVISRELFIESGGLAPDTFPIDDIFYMLKIGTSTRCAIIDSPPTVGYRWHDGNGHQESIAMGRAIKRLVRSEARREFPGGRRRILDRWAYIGGIAWNQARRAMKNGQRVVAVDILWRAMPHIVVGTLRKIAHRIGRRTLVVRVKIPDVSLASKDATDISTS